MNEFANIVAGIIAVLLVSFVVFLLWPSKKKTKKLPFGDEDDSVSTSDKYKL